MRTPVCLAVVGAVSFALSGCSPPVSVKCPVAAHGGTHWTELRSEHFVVRSDLAPSETRAISDQVESLYSLLRDVALPASRADTGKALTHLVIFRDKAEYGEVAPARTAWTYRTASPESSAPAFVTYGELTNSQKVVLAHQLAVDLVLRKVNGAPVWLDTGLANFFETIAVVDGQAVVGRPPPRFGFIRNGLFRYIERGSFTTALVPYGAMPSVRELLRMDRQKFYAESTRKTASGYEQREANDATAWALVHTLMLGPAHLRERFAAFTKRLATGMSVDEAWSREMGAVDEGELDVAMREHVVRTVETESIVLRTPYVAQSLQAPRERTLEPSEVHTMAARLVSWKGERAVWAKGQLDLAVEHDEGAPSQVARADFYRVTGQLDLAKATYERALAKDAQEPNALEGRIRLFGDSPKDIEQQGLLLDRLAKTARSANQLDLVARHGLARGAADEALPFAIRAVTLSPTCAPCLHTQAATFATLGRREEAVRAERRAIASLPSGADASVYSAALKRYESPSSP